MIPDFQTLMLPFLKLIPDGKEYSNKILESKLANQFDLTHEQVNELLPSKNQKKFYNRISWVAAYFKMASIIKTTKRGFFKITPLGMEILNKQPQKIDLKFIKQLPSFIEFKQNLESKKNKIAIPLKNDEEDYLQTPDELIDAGYNTISQQLEHEILEKLKTVSPKYFERIVVKLLVAMGYGGSIDEAGEATKYTNDEGIDGIIKEDKLGLDVIYLQAKRWEGNISRPEIQKFVGALAGQRAKKGVFITTSTFSKDAEIYARQMDAKIILIDGKTLSRYMIENNLGVSIQKVSLAF